MSKIEKLKKILGKKVGCYHKKKLASGAEKSFFNFVTVILKIFCGKRYRNILFSLNKANAS